jgi:DNA gyrase/topoisomerase IV subunit B
MIGLLTGLPFSSKRLSVPQRYENGIPVADLAAVEGHGTIGTTVHFMPGPAIRRSPRFTPDRVHETACSFPHLDVIVVSQG